MKIIDNALANTEFKKLQEHMLGDSFPWFLSRALDYEGDGDYQFFHLVQNVDCGVNSYLYEDLYALKNKLKIKDSNILRIKANLTPRREVQKKCKYHIDFRIKNKYNTAILYLNTNNGYTEFENKTKVESIENRLVVFDGHTPHRAVMNNCKTKYRAVININWLTEEEYEPFTKIENLNFTET